MAQTGLDRSRAELSVLENRSRAAKARWEDPGYRDRVIAALKVNPQLRRRNPATVVEEQARAERRARRERLSR